MSDFLNNFQDSNYKKQEPNEEKKDDKKQDDEKQEDSKENKHQIKARTSDDVKKSGGAFAQEKVEVDSDYNKFLYKRTITICGTVILSILLLIGLYFVSNQKIAITLVDMTEAEAVEWLEDKRVNYDITEAESMEVSKGSVISQSIPAGERIGLGDQQQIVVSSGPSLTEIVKLNKLSGKTKPEIEEFVKDNAIINVKYTTEYSTKVKAETLIRMSFSEETTTAKNYTRGVTVEFIISKGDKSDVKNKKVDNFVNQTSDVVYTWVEGTGIMIEEKEVASESPEGYIISQSVEPGEMLGFGDTLTIEVSKGPGIAMPYLIGYTSEQATDLATESGITVETRQKYSSSKAGIIISQSIASGVGVFADDSIIITESLGKPFLSSMSGMNLGDLSTTINDFNSQGANLTYTTKEVKRTEEDILNGVESGTIKSTSHDNKFVDIGSNIVVTLYA